MLDKKKAYLKRIGEKLVFTANVPGSYAWPVESIEKVLQQSPGQKGKKQLYLRCVGGAITFKAQDPGEYATSIAVLKNLLEGKIGFLYVDDRETNAQKMEDYQKEKEAKKEKEGLK